MDRKSVLEYCFVVNDMIFLDCVYVGYDNFNSIDWFWLLNIVCGIYGLFINLILGGKLIVWWKSFMLL